MTLRARLSAGFIGLLLVVGGLLGVVLVRSSRTVLVSQLDTELREVSSRAQGTDDRAGLLGDDSDDGAASPGLESRSVATLLVSSDGTVVRANPSGFNDDPDPLPDPSGYSVAPGTIQTIPSVDRRMHYRAVASLGQDGSIALYAVAMTGVDSAVKAVVATLLWPGMALLALGGIATWLTVRAALEPVEEMAETAALIAGGDLSRRVSGSTGSAEIDGLAVAFNEMLGQIEGAFARESQIKDQLKRFVSDASHELRTPLFALQGYAELYQQGALTDPAQLDNAMRRIASGSARMQGLTEDLLLLARIDEHRPDRVEDVDLSGVVNDVVGDARAIDPAREFEVETPDSLVVSGDPRRLAQVVTNLLTNASTHTPPGTPVTVGLHSEGNDAVLDVIDDGPGLEPELLEAVFDRFYRGDASRARNTGGTGLGLSIVAAIVDSHGGGVSASNEPGRGARFTVRLPLP
jgi:two-component system, OmpR family, sensor kinase